MASPKLYNWESIVSLSRFLEERISSGRRKKILPVLELGLREGVESIEKYSTSVSFGSLNWDHLEYIIDNTVKRGILTEDQLESLIDLCDYKLIVKFNKLSKDFIDRVIKPIVEKDEDYESITIEDVYALQKFTL